MGLFKKAFIIALFGICLYYIRVYMNGPFCESSARLDGKIVLITGANTGLGKQTTEEMVKRGATVILACRNMTTCTDAAFEIGRRLRVNMNHLKPMRIDLSSLESVRLGARKFRKAYKKLDILINNAGVMDPPFDITQDGYEQTFAINHLGPFLLTNLLMDLLIASQPSRIVNLASSIINRSVLDTRNLMMDQENYNGMQAYANSKLANVLFTKELASRLKDNGVTSYAVHPGVIVTDAVRHWPFQDSTYGRWMLKAAVWIFTKHVQSGAQTTLCCAIDEKLVKESGKYYSDCAEAALPIKIPENAAKDLWDMSMEMVKIRPDEMHPLVK